MGVPVNIENRPGANTVTGTLAVAKAAPDGYTLLATSNPFTIAPFLAKAPPYDPTKDFVAVAQVAAIPLVLVTSAQAPYKSVAELIQKEKLRYATTGKGALNHLEAEFITRHFKVPAEGQAFKTGAEALKATVGGQPDFFLANLPMALPQIQSGAARALAVSSSKPVDALPGVPTLGQAMGRPTYEASVWFGLVAPRGTPVDAITRIEDDLERELQDSAVKKRIESAGGRIAFLRSAGFGGTIGYEQRKWGEVAKAARAMQ
jgi:tripartite-type tricarboxylate transporter receptor subunit TctC